MESPAAGLELDPTVRLALTMHASPGAYACLLGAGVSFTSGIPTGWGMVVDLCARVARALGEDCGDDPTGWYQARFHKEPGYTELLATVAPTPAERSQLLRAYFEPTAEEHARGVKGPTPAHRALAELCKQGVLRLFVTTNFDRLLEKALEELNLTPMVVSCPDDLAGVPPLDRGEVTVVKIHGDYLDSRIKNTPEELDQYDPSMDALLDRVFAEHGLIVCGWSAQWDTALVRAVERCSSSRYGTFWTHVGPPRGNAARLLALRRGEFVQIDGADPFFTALAARVAALRGEQEPDTGRAASRLAPSCMPCPPSNFVGRRQLLERLEDRLGESRLLTLHGAGGVGKTRLAVELARRARERFPDGAWFVDLAPLTDGDQVPGAIGEALGVAAQRLQETLTSQRALLVLDNCEHLVDAVVAAIDPLLAAAPELCVLATSRARLGLRGEAVQSVEPMQVPAAGCADVDAAMQSEAVQLFVERAHDVNDRFALSSANAADVARVVRRLDGVPLALELAAARTRVVPVARLAARLDDVFHALPRGHREARPHQETLAAVWDWSWRLLSEPERQLCERLSVFRGSFSLDAAEEVGAGGALDQAEVLDALAELVDKSMLAPRPGEEGRYCMLEMVRQYAAQQLAERGELSATRERHARYFVALAERAVPETLGGAYPDEQYRMLVGEDDNLFAAAEWLLEHGAPEQALALTGSVGWFLIYGRNERRNLTLLERALEAAPDAPPGLRARGLGIAGWSSISASSSERAIDYLERAVALFESLDRHLEAAWFSLMRLGVFYVGGDQERAETALEALLRKPLPEHTAAFSVRAAGQAMMSLRRGALQEALAASQQAVAHAPDPSTRGVALFVRVAVLRVLARPDELLQASLQAEQDGRAAGDPMLVGGALLGQASARLLDGDVRGALDASARMLETFATVTRPVLVFAMGFGRISPPQPGDAEAAADFFEQLFDMPPAQAACLALERLLRASRRVAMAGGEQEAAARLEGALQLLGD